jgi:hypothetical protein
MIGGNPGLEAVCSLDQQLCFECLVHLELLEAINVLKAKVIGSYKLDCFFKLARDDRTNDVRSRARWAMKKWQCFVSFAIVRFRVWVKAMNSNSWSFTSGKTRLPPLGNFAAPTYPCSNTLTPGRRVDDLACIPVAPRV